MSDIIEIILTNDQYNGVHNYVGQLTGLVPATAATRLQALIVESLQVNLVEVPETEQKELPTSITITVDRKMLDAIWLGLVDMSKKANITNQELQTIKAVAAVLKMNGRMEKYVDSEMAKVRSSDLIDA